MKIDCTQAFTVSLWIQEYDIIKHLNIYIRMSYKAEIEFALHLHSFKNIQIDRQGFAAIRVEIFDQSAKNTNYALPYNIIPYHKSGLNYADPEISDTAFHSSTVRIQYQDQKYFLNDIIQFKLLVQSLPTLQTSKIYIKFTLLFSTLHAYNHDFNPTANGMQEITFKLQNIEVGLFHYYQSAFTENYASSFTFTLFSMITDFKLFPYSMRKQVIEQSEAEKKKERDREKVSQFEDLLIWASKYVKYCSDPLKYFYNCYAKILRYNSYVLRSKINGTLKKKRQTQLKLPKFYKQDQIATDQQFFKFFTDFKGDNVGIKQFKDEVYELHEDNFFFVQEVAQAMANGLFQVKRLEQQYLRYISSQYFSRFVKEVRYGEQLTNTSHAEETLAIANKIRKQKKEEEPYPIMERCQQGKIQEYLFYQISYSKSLIGLQLEKMKLKLKFPYEERNMLVVMCHGFQGSSFDMKIIQRGIKEALPLAQYLISRANEGQTQDDIQSMGKRVADEIRRYIDREGLPKQQLIINFVGHSMGGIIARACLKYIPEYNERLGFYCSLSSPHLGYNHGTDGMIKAGLWVMRKMMKQTKSLDQLSMEDQQKAENTFLYKLSTTGSLKNFNKVILISSAEDSYVPWHSARICGYKSKKTSSKIDVEMANNILGDQTIHRIDVNFAVEKNDIDGFIGRKAHINLIVNDSIFKLINAVIPKLFDLQEV